MSGIDIVLEYILYPVRRFLLSEFRKQVLRNLIQVSVEGHLLSAGPLLIHIDLVHRVITFIQWIGITWISFCIKILSVLQETMAV